MTSVRLTVSQLAHARTLALSRQAASLDRGLQGKFGGATHGQAALRSHEIGACGEVAVAVFFGWPLPTSVNTFHAPDLAGDIQVRTRSKHRYDLLVRPDDDDRDVFVHATMEEDGVVDLHGWVHGVTAKQAQWLRRHGDRADAYFVPASELHDIAILEGRWRLKT